MVRSRGDVGRQPHHDFLLRRVHGTDGFTALMWPRLTVMVLVALRRSALTVVHHLCVDDVALRWLL